jgi:hypothetical protein
MAVKVGSVVVDLQARNRDFVSGFRESAGAVATLKSQVLSLQGLLIGGAGLAGITAAAKATVDWAVSLGELNVRLGFSVEFLSQMKFVAEASGVRFNELATSMQRFTRRLAEARAGTGTLLPALETLGLDAEKLSQLNADEAFLAWADALSKIEHPGQRAALAMAGMDVEGVKVVQMLAGGTDAMARLREEADDLGLTITANTSAAATELAFELQRMTARAEGLVTALVSGMLPAVVDLVKGFNDFGSAAAGARAVGEAFGNMLNGVRIAANSVILAVTDTVQNILSLNRAAGLLLALDFEGAAAERESFARNQRQRTLDFLEETERLLGTFPAFERFIPAERFRTDTGPEPQHGPPEPDRRRTSRARNDALREANRLLAENARLTLSARSASEVLADTYADLRQRLEAGGISQRTFNVLVEQAREAYQRQVESMADQAPRFSEIIDKQLDDAKKGMRALAEQQAQTQRILTGTLQRGLQGLLDGTTTIKQAFSAMIADITSQLARLAAQEAFGQLFGGTGRTGGSPFTSFFGSLFSLLPGFQGGGTFRVGGSGGPDSQLVAFRATPGEAVAVGAPAQTAAGSVVIEQHLHFSGPPDALAAQQLAAQTALAVDSAARRNL